VSVWLTLRRQLVFFLLGLLLGALIISAAKPDHATELDIKLLQVDVAHLEEKVAEVTKRQDAVLAWINATDKQRVLDAELEGGYHARVEAHDWGVRIVIAACAANMVGLVFLFVKRKT
jgi:hypothetical protein